MIVSERLGFVFIHNPKCGGTSVRATLMKFDTTANFFWMFDEWNGAKIDRAHLPLYILRSKYPQYFQLLERYFTFMLVRNPYARAVSAFNQTNQAVFNAALAPTAGAPELAAYRQALNDYICAMTPSSAKGWEFAYRHMVRQFDLAYLDRKRVADLVMKIEDWPACLRQLAVFLPEVAAQLKATPKKNVRGMPGHFTDYLNAEAIRRIGGLYGEDFEVFGYELVR